MTIAALPLQPYSLQLEFVETETGDVLRRRFIPASTDLPNARLKVEALLIQAEANGFSIWQDDYGDGTETLHWQIFCDDDDDVHLEVSVIAEEMAWS